MAPESSAAREREVILSNELETLQRVATQLIFASGMEALYDRILDAAIEILGAEHSSIQLLRSRRGTVKELQLLGHRGFSAEAAKSWEWVGPEARTSCGEALRNGRRVVVPDVRTCGFMAGSKDLESYLNAGILAVQSTPLVSRSGAPLGMLSTHWRRPHELSPRELRGLDILARLAAEVIERAKADEALWESQQHLASIYDTVRDVIFHVAVDPDGQFRFVSVNAAFLRTTGLGRQQVIGKTVSDIVPEASLASVLQKYRQAIEEKTTVVWEETSDYPVGRITGVVSLTPVLDKSGRCTHLVGSVHDITERKQAEIALQESEQRFRHIANASPVMIWVADEDQGCTFVNSRWLEFTGRSIDRELGRGWVDTVHPEDRDRALTNYWTSFHTRQKFQMESRCRRADGQYRSILVTGAPLYRRGEFAGFIGSCLDITEIKRKEELLRASEAHLLSALRLAQLGSWERDEQTGVAEFSEEVLRILGWPAHPPRSLDQFLKFIHPDDWEFIRESSKRARATGEVEIGEYRIVRPDGEVRFVRYVVQAILNRRRAVTRVVGALQDITDFKRTQDESFARQKLESVGTLASGIAHDFNNLLGGVLAQADLALGELAAGAQPRDELKTIRNAAVRGSEVVRELMIYAGKDSESRELVDVSRAVKEMLELLKVSISKHATLETELAKDLPPVRVNAAQVQQIVMNLVVNASEALGDRDGVIRVTTVRVNAADGLRESDQIQIEVSDTGAGMSAETRARVFDPFFTTKSAGHGLGLAVVNGIVRSLNGKIFLSSEPGSGSTFRILLPCDTRDWPRNSAAPPKEVAQSSAQATVLVLDDEDILRQAAAKILRRHGFKVFEASNGSSAIEELRLSGSHIDLMLLDVTFQGPSIHEVIAEYAKVHPRPRVVLTSAYSEEMVRAAVHEPQVLAFIRKPFHLADLVKTLREALT
jgi:PAS domain S-box-containing protein